MADKQTIGISSLVALGIVLSSMIMPGFFDKPSYYCETRPEIGVVQCDSFSKYVAENGKCIRNDNANLICREGWIEVVDDTIIPDDIPEDSKENTGVWGQSFLCKSGQPCIPIN